MLPADPAHLANFLAESAERALGYSQAKQRACAIAALSRLALIPSPWGGETVAGCAPASAALAAAGVGAGRAQSSDTRSPLRTIPPRPPPPARTATRLRRAAGLGRQAGAGAWISAILSGAPLRWDCLQETRLGDAVLLPAMSR